MTGELNLRLRPEEAADDLRIRKAITSAMTPDVGKLNDFRIIRKSIDARQRQIWVNISVEYSTGDDTLLSSENEAESYRQTDAQSPQVIIVGAGPAGLFAALRALELGIRPIVIERGKDVESRLRDIVEIQKTGRVNPDSNFCFGEGGAGAYSDGKLFTRSKKRGNVGKILNILHRHGANENILYEAHPHIGSDKLPGIIKNIRNTIIEHGGEVRFGTKFEKLILDGNEVRGIVTDSGEELLGNVVLATGHSARDVYESLHAQGIRLEQKGFAMGVRLEHPQELIDRLRYHRKEGRGDFLPPAEYSFTAQVNGRGVYSFCMCPGGVIVPAASAPGEAIVNGMSASARGGRWANSGMVVELRPEDFPDYENTGPLGMLQLQKDLEYKFYEASDSTLNAPAQRMVDFTEGKLSADLPRTSYVCGIHPARLDKLLPPFISERLREAFRVFGRKSRGFLTNEATVIGLESRTSSPVRIPRDSATFHHPEHPGLYPAGEGAGFAGGIVSAAIDGANCIDAIYKNKIAKPEEQ